MNQEPSFHVIFLAGGMGTRMRGTVPKQYLLVHNKPLALYSFETLASLPEVREFVVVCEPQYRQLFQSYAEEKKLTLKFAYPGARRQDSVFNGMQCLEENSLVCIHDSARPLVEASAIRATVRAAEIDGAAVVGVKAKSTIKVCDENQIVMNTPNRDCLWEVQTPQVIRLNLLKEGFLYAERHQLTVTDDVSLVELLGKPVKVVEGAYSNIKVTIPEDLILVEQLIKNYALL